MESIKKYIDSVLSSKKAELVLKNSSIVDVFTQSIYKGDIAIVEDVIIGIGNYQGENEINCEGCFVVPAFIDAHVHIESSKVIPEIFSRALIKRGIMTCIADPHEIANVLGAEGIEFMFENSRSSVIDIFFMMPSCVPAVEFEDNGAFLKGEDLKKFINNDKVIGLGEVMDVPSVVFARDDMREKLNIFKDRVIDGHCPNISREWLNAYILSGIKTDHECTTPTQALEEVKRGMYVMLREGSAAKNVRSLLPAVNEGNFHRFLFCTDDKDISDLEIDGSIDHNIRVAVKSGLDPVKAITIATLNASQCYGLRGKGAIAPGYSADLVILGNLEEVTIKQVIRKGRIYEEDKYILSEISLNSSMNIDFVREEMFKIEAKSERLNVIRIIRDSIETERVKKNAIVKDGYIEGIESVDSLKIGVFERHKRTGKYSLGFIEGLGIKGCSVAQSIAHDSHNIIVVGDNDKDMETAVNRVIEMKGGIAVVSSEKIVEELGLPVAGLMTYKYSEFVIEKLNSIGRVLKKYKKENDTNILLTLGFISLPVIPEIKITARGLYDFKEGRFIDLFCSE